MADHAFGWGQLVYAQRGVGRVETERGQWALTSGRALWVPPRVRHRLHCTTELELRTLYFPSEPPTRLPSLPGECTVLTVGPLLEALLERLTVLPFEAQAEPRTARLLAVLHDELGAAPHVPLSLPMPRDPLARALADRLLVDPGTTRSLEQHCTELGSSRRTLERRFRSETGTTLGAWARQARLHHALSLLAHGRSVTEVARAVGYASPSAFVVAFQRFFGVTPARYIHTTTEPA